MPNPSSGKPRRGRPQVVLVPAIRTYYIELSQAEALRLEAERRGTTASAVLREILVVAFPEPEAR